jgi:MoaA/NifB/PqqE/SkfB family radical SAM enzyme
VKGSWEQTVEGIKNLIHMDTVVQVNTIVCRENYRDLLKFAEFLAELGVRHVKFNIFSYSFNPYINFFEKFQIPTNSVFIKAINKIEKSGIFDQNIEFM